MQSLGDRLQAYQGITNLSKNEIENEGGMIDKKNERILALIGIWIQAIGTIISALGLIIIIEEERLQNENANLKEVRKISIFKRDKGDVVGFFAYG